jgi:arsenate reductase
MAYTLLHNPRCSKSRQALAMLEEKGVPHVVRRYLDEPLSYDELRILKKRLGRPAAEWIRWGQDEAKGLDKEAPEQELLKAIAIAPILMERPILIRDDEALVGRPGPEVLLALL